jgi:hypothetical protein
MDATRLSIAIGAAAVVVAWAGMAIHDVYELPALVPADPQFTIPSAIYVVAGAAWALRPSAAMRALFGGWVVLNLIGGGLLSVLPLPFLPWVPEQSLAHYAVHVVYAAAQLPALWLLARPLGRRVVRESVAKPKA